MDTINFLNPPLTSAEVTTLTDSYGTEKTIYERFGVHIIEEEFKKVKKAAEGTMPYITKADKILEDIDFEIPGFDKILFGKFIQLMHQLAGIRITANETEAVLNMIDTAVKHNLVKMSDSLYSCLKAMKGGSINVESYVKALAEFHKSKGNRYDDNIISISPNTTFVISHIDTTKYFVNRGDAELKVYKGAVIGNDYVIAYPHSSVELPDGYDIILVQNVSTNIAGSFSVRQKKQ